MRILINILGLAIILFVGEGCQQSIAESKNSISVIENQHDIKGNVEIIKKYELPIELNEISGIAWISENTFACVQDEEGIIYVYDIEQAKILNEIKFAEKGDFEGLAVNGNTAYVQRSDGEIFIVNDFLGSHPVTKNYKTGLTSKQNIEGISYDGKNNRLLSIVKDKEPGKVDYKGVYGFGLTDFKMDSEPVFKIPAKDKMYKKAGLKKSTFYPSGISIYKANGHFFIVDGRQAGLFEMDANGNVENIYYLGTENFSQAESITFDNDGNIFISSEAGKEKAHITQIKISK